MVSKTHFKKTFPILVMLVVIQLMSVHPPLSTQADSDPLPAGQNTIYHLYFPAILKTPMVQPTSALSYYVQEESPASMWALGCAVGQHDQNTPGKQDNLVILNFGQPWVENGVYGAGSFTPYWHFISLADMETAVRNYLLAYYNCSGSDNESQMMVGIGTNNYGSMNMGSSSTVRRDTMYSFGQRWADMVNNLTIWAAQNGYSGQVSTAGAMDIEWGGGSWNTPAVTRAWVDGFNANDRGVYIYFNFGACSGCPSSYNASTTPTWVHSAQGWTINDVWYVSWGVAPSYAVPEIYLNSGVNARQWQTLSEYAARHKGGRIDYSGPMTQYQACVQRSDDSTCPQMDNTPEQGWQQLYDALNASPLTAQPLLRWVTDIAWQLK